MAHNRHFLWLVSWGWRGLDGGAHLISANHPANFLQLLVAKCASVARPLPEAGRDHVGDDTADILLLGRIIVGAGVIARDCHRPGIVAMLQGQQETCRIINILFGIEHVAEAAEMLRVIVMVDLHAAEIDQRRATAAGRFESGDCCRPRCWKDRQSLNIQRIGLQAPLVAGLRQADRVEDADGDIVAVGSLQDFRLARVGRGVRCEN